MTYADFLRRKAITAPVTGIDNPGDVHPSLFPFQQDVTRWALRRGRAAIFEECGLGKSRQAIEWARIVHAHTGRPVLILTPLAVASQFVDEAAVISVDLMHSRDGTLGPLTVTNYEQLEKFDVDTLGGVVIDESSVLKDFTSKRRNQLIEVFQQTPFRLACTATPAPNDHTELGNHAEFLGIMSRTEMLSTFFCHDGGSTQDWRVKGHARRDFWKWVCSWAVSMTTPSDLGYSDDGYILPALNVLEQAVETDGAMAREAGWLLGFEAATLHDQRAARRVTLSARVAKAAEVLAREPDEQWLVWCELNDESAALTTAIPGAVEVKGSDSVEHKEAAIRGFCQGQHRVMVSKPSICGHGVNMQHCCRVLFVGLSHSFEQWHQSTRRVWRFGQTRPVDCHVVVSDIEGRVSDNLRRKAADAERMHREMVSHMADLTKANLQSAAREQEEYNACNQMRIPEWLSSHAMT